MISFLVLTVLTFFLVWYVKGRINPSFRGHYLLFSMAIVVLGVAAVLVYTIDNLFHGQVDMPGDAQWYYQGALLYLQTGETQTFYPIYEKFLAAFLMLGDPILARLAQLMLFLALYALCIRALDRLNVSTNGLVYFSTFTAFSGIYYGTLVVLVRDFLILFAYVFAFFILVWYYIQTEARQRAPNVKALFLILLVALLLRSLGPWLIYPLIAGVLGEMLLLYKKKVNRRFALVGIVIVGLFLAYGGFSEIQRLYQVVVVDAVLLEAVGEMLGVERTRSLLDPFAALLGPGLIRPLFPGEFFIVWIPSHAAFYWWGTVFWYINLIFSLPLIFRKPFAFLGKRGAVFALVVFVFLVGAYTLAYGSGMGMRKRMMFHFLYTLFIAAAYYTPLSAQNSAYAQKLVFPLPRLLVRLGVILMLMVATIMSVYWN
jgi:hypothetical protein